MIKLLPHPRPADEPIGITEDLYRRISINEVDEFGGALVVTNLAVRLSACSFNRSKYSTPMDVVNHLIDSVRNGVAVLPVARIPGPFAPAGQDGKVHELYVVHTPMTCEEPPLDLYPHSELFVRRQGINDSRNYVPNSSALKKKIRDDVASKMSVSVRPVAVDLASDTAPSVPPPPAL